MKTSKNQTLAILISTILVISIGASMIAVPTAQAHTPIYEIKTYAYINVAPNPIGVGQPVHVIMWLDKVPNGATSTNSIRFHNYNLAITKPDGSKETIIFDVCTDPTSAQFYAYTPTTTGNYTFDFSFPGQTYTWSGDYQNDTYTASSATTSLTVQEEQITVITSYPLPTEYWTHPIYGENTDWWSISSNWLGTGAPNYNGITTATGIQQVSPGDAVGSQTSHVMWTKALLAGGVAGGNNLALQGETYYEGSAGASAGGYKYANPIILNGKLYYTEPMSSSGTGPTDCVDLRTGELIWSRSDIPALSFGVIYDYQTMAKHGVYSPILVATSGTTWMAYDSDTGTSLFNVTNVPTGTKAMSPNGEYLNYVIANAGTTQNPAYYLSEWNWTKLWTYTGGSSSSIGGIVNGGTSNRYDWNVSIPWFTTLSPVTVIQAYYGDEMICYSSNLPNGGSPTTSTPISNAPYTYFAVQLNASKGLLGSIIWQKTYDAPASNITVLQGGVDTVNRVFVESYKETMQWVGYSMDTGARIWGPTASQTDIAAFDYYGNQYSGTMVGQFAYGKLYCSGFAGIMYCYDTANGNLLWTYGNGGVENSTSAGYYNAYGVYPTMIMAIGNDVVYTVVTEHTITAPIYKGAMARAINATDGTEIWTLSNYASSWSYAIADGYCTVFNGYDNQVYTIGRGTSAITVSAPNLAAAAGQSVVISGSVMDTSSGITQNGQAARFPNGVPVCSDASMTDWMGYVYQQKPKPTNFTGVTVTINVIDANGNYRTIGTTTTDSSGSYGLQWTPDIPGKYTVAATFAGTNGYWSSDAETYFAVDPAIATPTPQPIQQLSMADLYFVPAIAGLFIALIVVGLLIILVLRKRP